MIQITAQTTARRMPAGPVARRDTAATADDAQSAALARIGARATVRRGEPLFHEGDPADHVFKVVAGAVRTTKLMSDGRRYVVDFLFPGDFFGFSEGKYRTATAEALCDAIIVRYPRAAFEQALQSDAGLGRFMLTMLCGGLSLAHERMLLLGRKTAVEKIASFLLMMADRKGADTVELPMTRADIADYLGLTVETVSRTMTQLRSEGVIRMPDPAHIALARRAALETIAEGA